MNKQLFYVLAFLLTGLLYGCWDLSQQASPLPVADLNGTYKGTFQRGSGDIANVTLVFNNGSWTGESNIPRYPALCNGIFQINNGGKLLFENRCPWTADFDWTLILNGDFEALASGSTLILRRNTDVYRLTKQ